MTHTSYLGPESGEDLLRRVRDFAAADGCTVIDRKAAASALARLDVDEQGLDSLDRRYLRALIENYAGGPAGVETLAYAIAEARDAVEDVIEPFLLQQGFLQRTPRGRNCTLIRGPTGLAVFGTACSQVRWQLPPMTSRSPWPTSCRRVGPPPPAGRSRSARGSPREMIATIVSWVAPRPIRSPCQATLSRPSR